jgi:predicted Zn-dependent protease
MARCGLPALLVAALAAGPSCGGASMDAHSGQELRTPSPEAMEQYLLGAISAENGDHEAAAAYFEAAVALDPEDPFLKVEHAKALTACGRYDDARAELDRALAADPTLPEARAALAELNSRATAP